MNKPYDIIIVGAGAAGMTAALYALRAKKSVLLLEQKVAGGQIVVTHKIDNFPAAPGISGLDFAKTLKQQVESFGGEFEYANVVKITTDGQTFQVQTDDEDISPRAKSVILAPGSTERKLGLSHEESYIGHGVSYCATCDANFYKGKTVAVYGAGNTALYSTLYLSNLAQKVYLINHGDHYRADQSLVEKAKTLKNVQILENSAITALSGAKRLESITINHDKVLSLDGLFVSIGRVPDNTFLKDFIELDDQGYIKSDETCKTSRKGVFCAGDCRKKPVNQLTTAVADGAVAASAAVEYLNHLC